MVKDSSSERLKKLTNSIIEKQVNIESIGDCNHQQLKQPNQNHNDHQVII